MDKLRIAIIYDDGVRGALAGVRPDGVLRGDIRIAIVGVEDALRGAGHETARVPIDYPISRCLETIERGGFDLVFNLCEGVGDVSTGEIAVAGLLDLARVRYTGSDPLALALALNKARTKEILAFHGIPTPRWALLRGANHALPAGMSFPAIVKPAFEDGSLGIENASVVKDAAALRARVEWVEQHFAQPSLAEEFIDGRELNVSVLGGNGDYFALPIAEIDFSRMPADKQRIVSFNAKWREDTVEFSGTVPVVPAILPEAVASKVRDCALRAAAAIGVRDYARIDLRLDQKNRPYVLEVNPNPDISPDAGLPRAAKVHGWSYEQLVLNVVEMARRRTPQARRSVRSNDETGSP